MRTAASRHSRKKQQSDQQDCTAIFSVSVLNLVARYRRARARLARIGVICTLACICPSSTAICMIAQGSELESCAQPE